MKKNRFFLFTILAAGLLMAGCGGKTVQEPEFEESEKGVVFTAYAAPTVNRKVDAAEELEEHYKKLAEAGFNQAIALHEGDSRAVGEDVYDTIRKKSEAAETAALAVLDIAERCGVKYWVRDWSFYGLGRNYKEELQTKEQFDTVLSEMFGENNRYIDHPAYGGNFGFDEPNVQDMETIAWQIEYYQKYIKENSATGGEIFVNLLPAYITDNSLTLSENKDYTYREYVDYYFEHLAPMLGYVCWDFYPFVNSGSENYIRDMYYYNLELMAQKCKEKGYELRTFVQAKGDFTGIRQLDNIGDFRFQIYSGMAFGVRQFVYYTYGSSVGETDYTADNGYSLYNYKTGEYTWEYDAAKQVNNEIHAMEDAYMAYDWEGVMFKNASEMIDNQLFANLTSPLDSCERMEIVSCTQDAMAGIFRAKDKESTAKDAFMIVNVTDPIEKRNNEVTVRFEGASALLMYRFGEKKVVPLNKDGSYTFILQPGEGRFVIPL